MTGNDYGYIAVLLSGVGVALLVYLLVHKSLRALLSEVLGLPSGTVFYVRVFFLGLLFIGLATTLDTSFDFKPGAAFMEYVWKIADGISSTFSNICLFAIGYLLIVTILIAALRRRHE